jgi:hemicentin
MKLTSSNLTRLATTAVDGGWSDWQNATQCSVTCGGGVLVQIRECSNPAPQHGGDDCDGKKLNEVECNPDPCPGM